ncbi:hypothetical protein ACA040_004352 [Xenophilus aerolatus]
MNPAPTPDERIDAIEEFLAQLVLLLEVEPNITKDTVTNWLQLSAAAVRAHKTKSPRQQAVFGQLCERVLDLDVEAKPDERAQQATRAALKKAKRPPSAA